MLAFSSGSILGRPPVHSLAARQLLVVALARTELEGFLAPKAKDSEHAEASVKQLVNPILQCLVEVDQHVPAQNHIELVERAVARQVVLRKQYVFSQGRPQNRALVLFRVVVRKYALAPGACIVAFIRLDHLERIDSGPGPSQNSFIYVGRIDPAPVIYAFLLEQNGQRVNLFSGRTSRVPDSDEGISP